MAAQKPTKTKTYIGQGFNFLPIGPGVQISARSALMLQVKTYRLYL